MEQDFIKQIQNLKQNINLQEAIQMITELTIYGDQQNQDIFDLFIEEKIFDEFLYIISKTKDQEIVVTVLQSVSMLFTNITKNLIVLLSQPQLNEFIIFDYNLKKEEISDYYINFIKILSNKLNPKNINLFFNSKYCCFPLLLYSQNFYNSADNLTRIYTRHLLLQILKITLESKQRQILILYLQSYPFLQVLTNHVQFKKDLLLKSFEKDDKDNEELKIMDYFFKDLSLIAPELKQILDNMILQIIILPYYKVFSNFDDDQKTFCFQIILHFLYNKIYLSEKLTVGILALIFSHQIPQIQIFQFEPNYLPVQDADLKNICSQFFLLSQEKFLQQSKSVFLDKLHYSFMIINNLINFYSIKTSSKQQQFKDLLQNDLIANLQMTNKMSLNHSNQYNIYNIYAQFDSLNFKHYQYVLIISDVLIMNRHIYEMTFEQKIAFLINLIKIMIDESEKEINTIENCKKTIQIIKELLSIHEKTFTIAFIRSKILKKMEIHFLTSDSIYYKYFFIIQQCIENDNIENLKKKPETFQVIRFLMFLNVIFEKGWLINPFKKLKYNLFFNRKNIIMDRQSWLIAKHLQMYKFMIQKNQKQSMMKKKIKCFQ